MSDPPKTKCKYGTKCYQTNKVHLAKYLHPLATKPATDEAPRKRKRSPEQQAESATKDSYNLRRQSKSPKSPEKSTDPGNDRPQLAAKKSPDTSVSSASCSIELSPSKDLDFISDVYDKETRFSQRAEYKDMLKDPNIFIKNKFLVQMPDDFFIFWEYCKASVKRAKRGQKPEELLQKFGITLLGPFDVLAGKFDGARMFEPGDYLRHCRYYYDPPEFQTIFRRNGSGIHYGYWRDDPLHGDCFLAKNNVEKGCEFTIIADNIFGAILHFLEHDVMVTPFNKASIALKKKSLEEWSTNFNVPLDKYSQKIKARNLKVVAKTFHRAGLVVPYDKKTGVGYRELIETDANLKNILNLLEDVDGDKPTIDAVMEKLYPLITAANIAVDECDFGNSIELGLDLFASGSPVVHKTLLQLLVHGYTMVKRPQYVAIIKAHLEQRQKGTDLSIV